MTTSCRKEQNTQTTSEINRGISRTRSNSTGFHAHWTFTEHEKKSRAEQNTLPKLPSVATRTQKYLKSMNWHTSPCLETVKARHHRLLLLFCLSCLCFLPDSFRVTVLSQFELQGTIFSKSLS